MKELARGFRGGQAFRGLLQVDLNFPTAIRLRIDGDKVKKAIGNGVAAAVRSRLRQGLDGDGSPLPAPASGGAPLNARGSLIRSIRYDPRLGFVLPRTTRREDVSKRARSNFGLMAILISGVFVPRGRQQSTDRPMLVDPMGSDQPSTVKLVEEFGAKELKRQEQSGELGLVLELKRSYRQAKRLARG